MGAMMGSSKSIQIELLRKLVLTSTSRGCHNWVHIRYSLFLAEAKNVLIKTGSVNIMRYGAGPNGVMRSLGQYMLGSGATFGFVFSVVVP
jgi:hypothetical protein